MKWKLAGWAPAQVARNVRKQQCIGLVETRRVELDARRSGRARFRPTEVSKEPLRGRFHTQPNLTGHVHGVVMPVLHAVGGAVVRSLDSQPAFRMLVVMWRIRVAAGIANDIKVRVMNGLGRNVAS